MLTVPGLPTGWLGAVVHGAPDTALQNDQICASQRAKPGGGDLRHNGGYRVSHERLALSPSVTKR